MFDVAAEKEATPLEYSKVISTAVIPIGIPLTTGAGVMSTVILFAESLHHQWAHEWKLLAAILVMTWIIYATFRQATLLARVLGTTGMGVVTKIFGLITLAIGVQFIFSGIRTAFPHLG